SCRLQLLARIVNEAPPVRDLLAQHRASARRQLVVAALGLLAVGGRRLAICLAQQPGVEQALNGFVQRARAKPHGAAGQGLDLELDAVAVPRALGEGQEDVEDGRRERASQGSHRRYISQYDMYR